MENLFPVLLEGLERLSREVESYIKDPQDIDIEVILIKNIFIIKKVRRRFNPCIFLA